MISNDNDDLVILMIIGCFMLHCLTRVVLMNITHINMCLQCYWTMGKIKNKARLHAKAAKLKASSKDAMDIDMEAGSTGLEKVWYL